VYAKINPCAVRLDLYESNGEQLLDLEMLYFNPDVKSQQNNRFGQQKKSNQGIDPIRKIQEMIPKIN
jgi:hypothetical protein